MINFCFLMVLFICHWLKIYNIKLKEIKLPPPPLHYYELGYLEGIITSIGGESMQGKAEIRVNNNFGESIPIEIEAKHERELIQYYKSRRVRFYIKMKFSFENDKLVSAILEDFDPVTNIGFFESMDLLRQNNVFSGVEDSYNLSDKSNNFF